MRSGSKIIAVLLLGVCCIAPSAAQAATPSGFSIVPSATLLAGNFRGDLTSVAAVSASDVWAAGTQWSSTGQRLSLVEHWNGTSWSLVTPPNTTSPASMSVSAGGGAVWAAEDISPFTVQLYRWNGTQFVAAPPIPDGLDYGSLTVISNTDVWFAGIISLKHVLFHWNGKSWTQVEDPDALYSSVDTPPVFLAVAGGGVFVAGNTQNPDPGPWMEYYISGLWRSLGFWTTVHDGQINGLSASSPSNAWVVGSKRGKGNIERPYAIRWNAKVSKQIDPPGYATSNHWLEGVLDNSPTDVWAVGGRQGTNPTTTFTLIDHYDGKQWTDLGGPNVPGLTGNSLAAITAVPGDPSDLWAVGGDTNGALILHHSP